VVFFLVKPPLLYPGTVCKKENSLDLMERIGAGGSSFPSRTILTGSGSRTSHTSRQPGRPVTNINQTKYQQMEIHGHKMTKWELQRQSIEEVFRKGSFCTLMDTLIVELLTTTVQCTPSIHSYFPNSVFRIRIRMFLGLPDPHPDPLVTRIR
jgi:hypothetical protein